MTMLNDPQDAGLDINSEECRLRVKDVARTHVEMIALLGMPLGARIVKSKYDEDLDIFYFTVRHPSFPERVIT